MFWLDFCDYLVTVLSTLSTLLSMSSSCSSNARIGRMVRFESTEDRVRKNSDDFPEENNERPITVQKFGFPDDVEDGDSGRTTPNTNAGPRTVFRVSAFHADVKDEFDKFLSSSSSDALASSSASGLATSGSKALLRSPKPDDVGSLYVRVASQESPVRKGVLQPKHYRVPTSPSSESPEKDVRRSNREEIGEMSAASRTENWRYAARASEQEACRYAVMPGNTPVKDKDNELLTDCYPADTDELQTAIQTLQLVENKLLLNEQVRFEEKRKKESLEKRIAAVESHSRLMVLELEEIQERMLVAADAWTTKQELFITMPHIVHPAEVQHAALKSALRTQCVKAEHRHQQQQLRSAEQEQCMCMQQHSDEVLQVFMVNAVHSLARFCSDAPMQQGISGQEVFTKPSTETTEEEKATQSGRDDDIAACDGKCRCAALESNAAILRDNEAKCDALIQDVQALQRQMKEYHEQAEQRLQDFHQQLEQQFKRNSEEIVCLEDNKVRVW